jgi:hypothetical protein
LTEQGVCEADCLDDPDGYERYAREEGVGVVDGFFMPMPDIDTADICDMSYGEYDNVGVGE